MTRGGAAPQRVGAALALQVAAMPAQVLQHGLAAHWTAMVSLIASGGTPPERVLRETFKEAPKHKRKRGKQLEL